MIEPDLDRLVAELQACQARNCDSSEALGYIKKHGLEADASTDWGDPEHKTTVKCWVAQAGCSPMSGFYQTCYSVAFHATWSGRVIKVEKGGSYSGLFIQ